MKKKFMSVMLAATLVVSLVGCGKKNNNNTATDADDTSNKAITAEEYNATIASNAAVYKKYITLPEYKGIAVSVDKSSLTVSDDDVETYISNILSSHSTSEQVTEGTTASGDTISLDYSGKLDGVAFSGGTATDVSYTIGSGKFITDLDQGLIGLNVGQEYDIPCTFPSDYSSSDLAGKSVIFTVKVTAIVKTNYPEITDDWVLENKETLSLTSNNVPEFKEEIRKVVEANANDTYMQATYASAYAKMKEAIGDNVTYQDDEIQSLTEVFNSNIENEFNNYGSYYGVSDLDSYKTKVYGFDSLDAYDEYVEQQAKDYLLEKMVVTVIAADNDIHVTEDELVSYGNDLATYYGYDDFTAITEAVGNEVVSEVGYQILYQKVIDFVCSQISEVEQ